jgi:DNA-binding MurR/RpiR family transcriptional regulator
MHIMQDGSDVREFMAREAISEATLAKQAGVSQSTVSRAIAGVGVRYGAARSKLFTYIHNHSIAVPPKKGVQRVVTAFERIWDRTEEHAAVVARIIDALESLRPVATKRR